MKSFSRRDRMVAHLRSYDRHNMNVVNEGSGRRPYRLPERRDERGISSPDRRRSRLPTGSRRFPRPSRSATRGRAERRRRTTPGESSSASPDPSPERRMTDYCPSQPDPTGNSLPPTLRGGLVIGLGMPSVSIPVPEVVRPVTVKEFALKIIQLINTLKALVADLQLTLSVFPRIDQAVRELEQKCFGFGEALKLLNQSSLAYDFSKLFRGVDMPLSAPVMPTMVGILANEVMTGPAPCGSNTVVSPPSVDLSMLDFDNLFE